MMSVESRMVVGFRSEMAGYLCRAHAEERHGALAVSRAEAGLDAPLEAVYGWQVEWTTDESEDDGDSWGTCCDDCGEPFVASSGESGGETER